MKKQALIAAVLAATTLTAASATPAFAKTANPFKDLPADHWAYDAVAMLAKDGVLDGYGDGNFNGTKLMNRYEMAEIVAKAAQKYGSARPADKGAIKKLQREFSAELKDMDSRLTAVEGEVTELKKKQSSFQWYGDARIRYFKNMNMNSKHGENWGERDRVDERVRLGLWATPAKNVSVKGLLQYEDHMHARREGAAGEYQHGEGDNFNTWDNSYNMENNFRVKQMQFNWDNAGSRLSVGRLATTIGQGLIYWDTSYDGLELSHQFGPKLNVRVGYGDIGHWMNNNHWSWRYNVAFQASPATQFTVSGLNTTGTEYSTASSFETTSSFTYKGQALNTSTGYGGMYTVNATTGAWDSSSSRNYSSSDINADGSLKDAGTGMKWVVWNNATGQQEDVDTSQAKLGYSTKQVTTWTPTNWKLNQIAYGMFSQLAPKWRLTTEYMRNNNGSYNDRNAYWARLYYGKQNWSKANTWELFGEYIRFGGGAVDPTRWFHHMEFAGGDYLGGHGAKGWGLGGSYMFAPNTNLLVEYYNLKPFRETVDGETFSKYNSVLSASFIYSF